MNIVIKLIDADGVYVWLNIANISGFRAGKDAGTIITMNSHFDRLVCVKESPEMLVNAINAAVYRERMSMGLTE